MKEETKNDLPPLSELISLRNKKALITGSAAGIGEAIAYRFAEAGADLELVDIDETKLLKVKEALKQFKTEINIHKVDLSKKEKIDATLEFIQPSLFWMLTKPS